MKKNMSLFVFFIGAVSFCFSQNPEQNKLFTMIYTTGEKWNDTISTSKQAYFKEHSEHLVALRKKGVLIMGGRYSDKGFMILKAKDIDEANAITRKDVSVVHRTFKVEIFEFNPFYEGCIGNEQKN